MEVKTKKLPKSQLELEFNLTAEEFKEHMGHAVEHLKKHVKVDGFRPGQAPASMVEDKIKPEALLMEAGDHAVRHVYLDYIKEQKLEPVGNPEVSIIKIAKGSELIFKAVITLLPDVELPDYKEIAKKVKGQEISVTEQEVEDSINYLQKTRAKFSAHNNPAEKKDFVEIEYSSPEIDKVDAAPQGGASLARPEGARRDKFILGEGGFVPGFEEAVVGMKAGEEKEAKIKFPENYMKKELAGKEVEFKIKIISVQKVEYPELNDEFAKQLGAFSAQGGPASGWDTLVALKENIKKGIEAEKTEQEKQRRRGEILEKIAEKAKFEMPVAMVEYEKERLLEDLKSRVSQMFKNKSFSAQGGPASGWEQYLASVKKTEEEIKDTYQKEAEKRLRGFLVLRELGRKENVEVSDKEVEEETAKALENYRNQHAGHNHDEIDLNELKEYTKGVIINEKIFKKLEECQ